MKINFLIFLLMTGTALSQDQSFQSIMQLESEINSNLKNYQTESPKFTTDLENEKKSVGLGIIYSLLLPGMGELYADAYDMGKYFTIADGILWGTYIGMSSYTSWQEDNYKSYAAVNAGVDNSNKDADYYATISEYSNIESYNDQKALERNFDEMYNEQVYFWKWQTSEERETYRDMWLSSEQTSNDLRFIVGGLLLNRVVSAINAARLVSKYNSRLEEQTSWNISVGFQSIPNLPTNLSLRFSQSF
ncbi:MAG TPA: hypothetical protein VI362_07205 [Ignavibacteriaceae bacterium]|nr:hypothetical protein [Ignavibacteriaceae bacterium]